MKNLKSVIMRTLAYWYPETDDRTLIHNRDKDELIIHLEREVMKWVDEQPNKFAVLYYNQINSVWDTKSEAERAAIELTQGGIVVPIPAVRSGILDDIDELRKGYQRILALIGPEGAAHSMDDLMFQVKEIKKIAMDLA